MRGQAGGGGEGGLRGHQPGQVHHSARHCHGGGDIGGEGEDLFSTADHCSLLCCRCAGLSWVPPTARRRSWSCPRRAASRLCTDTPTALRRGSRLSSEHVIYHYAMMQDPALEPGCYITVEKIIYFI